MEFKNILIICLAILLFFCKKNCKNNCKENSNQFDLNNDGNLDVNDFNEFTQRAFENNIDLMKTYAAE